MSEAESGVTSAHVQTDDSISTNARVVNSVLGSIQFWDSKYGTQIQSISQHESDILAVAVSGDGKTVYASGVDTQVEC